MGAVIGLMTKEHVPLYFKENKFGDEMNKEEESLQYQS